MENTRYTAGRIRERDKKGQSLYKNSSDRFLDRVLIINYMIYMTPARNSILSIAIVICLIIAAGCTSTAGLTQHPVQLIQSTVQATQQYTP